MISTILQKYSKKMKSIDLSAEKVIANSLI